MVGWGYLRISLSFCNASSTSIRLICFVSCVFDFTGMFTFSRLQFVFESNEYSVRFPAYKKRRLEFSILFSQYYTWHIHKGKNRTLKRLTRWVRANMSTNKNNIIDSMFLRLFSRLLTHIIIVFFSSGRCIKAGAQNRFSIVFVICWRFVIGVFESLYLYIFFKFLVGWTCVVGWFCHLKYIINGHISSLEIEMLEMLVPEVLGVCVCGTGMRSICTPFIHSFLSFIYFVPCHFF